MKYAFWGSDEFSIKVLEELLNANMRPSVIISVPDQPKGRKQIITPTLLKNFAESQSIECITPSNLSDQEFLLAYSLYRLDVAVVASYGKIIPQIVLDVPTHKTLNVHPSLLPLWRGSSPIQNTILHDDVAGVSIMLLDSKMDHGPLLNQKEIPLENPDTDPLTYESLRDMLATIGGQMLAKALPEWVAGNIETRPQEHSQATTTKTLKKSDGLVDLSDNPFANIRKIRAYNPWPGAYFIIHHNDKELRVKIIAAHIEGDKLEIERVIPEGKNEMDWVSFERGYVKNKDRN